MAKIQILYIEDDPALNGFISEILRQDGRLELVQALQRLDPSTYEKMAHSADVALIDLSLGRDEANGIQLGLALRKFNPTLGITIYSQHFVSSLFEEVPAKDRSFWSYVQKHADISMADVIDVCLMCAKGFSVYKTHDPTKTLPPNLDDGLTHRHKTILELASSGISNSAIANKIGISEVSVRKDFSKIYTFYNIKESSDYDMRTLAILQFVNIKSSQGA